MSDWLEHSLGEVATIEIGGTPSRDVPHYWATDGEPGLPWVSIADLKAPILYETKEQITKEGAANSNVKAVSPGSLIMSFKLSIGRTAIAGVELYTNEAIAAVLPRDDRVHPRFLSYVLPPVARNAVTDTAVKGATLNKKTLAKLILRLPTDPDCQAKIADILASIDEGIEHTCTLIEKYQQIKVGLMHDLFTRGIGADGKLRPPRKQAPDLYQETPIGWIPKEWEAHTLNFLLARDGGYLQTGPFGSQLHSHEYTEEGIPVVMPQDISEVTIGESNIARIPEKRAQSLLKHRMQVGDIIIARRGELSRAAAISAQEKCWVCGTGCFLLRLGSSRMNAKFIALAYRHPVVQRQVEGLAVGSTMPSLNNEIMGKLLFPDINPTEQSLIAERVSVVENRLASLNAELAKLHLKKQGLMQDLLTGKVEVTPNTATKEAVDVQD